MTVFAYHVSTCCLHVVADASDALACMSVSSDIEDWLFFDKKGLPLRLDRISANPVFLRPWASCASCSLEQVLYMVQEVAGGSPLDSVEAVRTYLGQVA